MRWLEDIKELNNNGFYYCPNVNLKEQLLFACGSYYDGTGDLQTHFIGIVHRHNDVEDKLVAAPEGINFTHKEITEAIHFQEQYYESEIEVICFNEYFF